MSHRRRLLQRAQPAGALGLLRHARFPGGPGFDALAEVALKCANAKRTPALCHRQRRMHGNPHGALAAAVQRRQPVGRVAKVVVVQHGGVLHHQHHTRMPAALHRGLAMPLEDVVHSHPFVRKQAVRSLLRCTVRKDLRKRRSRTLLPTPPHLLDPAPHPPVGMGAPAELALRPVGIGAKMQRSHPPRNPLRLLTQCFPPARLQRLHPHPAHRPRPAPARRAARCRASILPARRTVRGPGMLGADIAVRQHRPITMPCCPVVRNPTRRLRQHMRGKVRNPHRRQEQEAVVVHYPPQSRATGSRAPANISVPRLLVPARRAEADPTQTPEPRRYHQIVQRFAGMPRNPLRMVRRHHRTETPRTLATLDRFQRHRPQSRQRRLHMQVRMRRQCIPRRRRRCRRRKPQPQLRRQPRQDLPRRRNARLAPRVAPLCASAQLARKRAPARASLPDRALKPRKRFRAKLSQANLHASCMPQNPARVNSVIVTGPEGQAGASIATPSTLRNTARAVRSPGRAAPGEHPWNRLGTGWPRAAHKRGTHGKSAAATPCLLAAVARFEK